MEISCTIDEFESKGTCSSTEKTIVPKFSSFLGLDISELSSGICIYRNGIRYTYNFSLELSNKSCHSEVLLRRSLKANLREFVFGMYFDVIILEDVFQGINATTTRMLYALNTAIDEMILDEEVFCGKFFRVSNKIWKSWLYKLDVEGLTKGLNDKLRISMCLSMIGIEETGNGYQDRLDATGMVIGYLLNPNEAEKSLERKLKKRVNISDVVISYCAEQYDVFEEMQYSGVTSYKNVIEKRWSKNKILDYLTDNPEIAYLSKDYVILGNLAKDLNLPFISDGGILGFWVKPEKLKKYIKEC